LKRQITPRQLAQALSVSESSIKRWCDDGVIETERTAGGHRRIPQAAAMKFVKVSQRTLTHPELLGLPSCTGETEWVVQRAQEQLCEGLLAGSAEECRRILLDLFLADWPVHKVCDQVIAKSFHQIGDRWECGDAEVYQERRACEIVSRILREWLSLIEPVKEDAPLAIGGSPENDPYSLPSFMVELTLRSRGWKAVTLGENLPFATLRQAVIDTKPNLFWLSVSHLEDEENFVTEYEQFVRPLEGDPMVVVGGRALTLPLRKKMTFTAHCDNLEHLDTFSQAFEKKQKERR